MASSIDFIESTHCKNLGASISSRNCDNISSLCTCLHAHDGWHTLISLLLHFRVEKYRPKTLDDLISHKDIISTSMCIV